METRSSGSRIHRLEFDVEWPPGHVVCYLVDGPEPILVDAAIPQQSGALAAALSERGHALEGIEHVLITHPHIDHIGCVADVLDAAEPTVHAPASVLERFEQDPEQLGERVRRNCIEAGFAGDDLETAVGMAVQSLERNAKLLPVEAVDDPIRPGETRAIGDLSIDAVHLPGHQADHLSYVADIDGERILLAGDMGIQPFRPVLLHDGLDDGYPEAFDAFYTALDRMAALDVDRVYPGHGPIHDDLETTVDRDRSSLDARLDRVHGLVADGHEIAPAVADALAGTHNVNYLIPETMSALAHLEAIGRLETRRTDGVRRYIA